MLLPWSPLLLLCRLWVCGQGAEQLVHHIYSAVARSFSNDVRPVRAECGRSVTQELILLSISCSALKLSVSSLDVFSRYIVGWSMANHLRTRLVLDALDMALGQRRPETAIHHSAQYTSIAFGTRCREAAVRPSMGSVGDAYDNALCESFFANLE